ncbi:MAG: ferric reductase-like transmembrane domain-containing protein [Acidimicrobiia bacterium]
MSGGSTLWFLSRATGIVAFVLLTVTVVLGIVTSLRWQTVNIPRFVIEYVHRNVTVLVLALIAIHITTVVVDGFAPIGWIAAVVPFSSPYRPIWLSLGALGFDLMLAVAVTSWLRHRVGFRVWRFLHWSAYASWLLVLVHAFGTGTDTREGWALLVEGGCAALVVVALWLRIGAHWEQHTAARAAALVATVVVPLALAGWLLVGPLAPNWAHRAGTPASVLARTSAQRSSR